MGPRETLRAAFVAAVAAMLGIGVPANQVRADSSPYGVRTPSQTEPIAPPFSSSDITLVQGGGTAGGGGGGAAGGGGAGGQASGAGAGAQGSAPSVPGTAVGGESVSLLGDLGPGTIFIPPVAFGPTPPGLNPGLLTPFGRKVATIAPSARAFKIAEDQSPVPHDRVYVDFNYFDQLNASVNQRMGTDLQNPHAFRENFGVEKTLFDGQASIGLRVPYNTFDADSHTPGFGGSSSSFGDLTVIGKYAFWEDADLGMLLSTGLAVTVPTGPSAFAGFGPLTTVHDTRLQPYLGYYWQMDDWFVHGFTSVDIPTDSRDLTMSYNDVGIGYILYRSGRCEDRYITTVIPTFEVHANIPLDHHGALNPFDPLGTADVIDLTSGVTFGLGHRATLAFAVVAPVTGPRPFDVEAMVQFNMRFGPGGIGRNGGGILGR